MWVHCEEDQKQPPQEAEERAAGAEVGGWERWRWGGRGGAGHARVGA